MARVSRRQLAHHAADKLHAGTPAKKVIAELAAFLVDTRRAREVDLLVRDIEEVLAAHGTVVADVTSAYPLPASIKAEIMKLVHAKDLHLRMVIDPNVLGGIRIDVAGQQFDGTLRRKLTQLKAKQL